MRLSGTRLLVVGLWLAAFHSRTVTAQILAFPETWLFRTGDDLQYKAVECDDSGWQSIRVPGQWENAGLPRYDGFAWYRLHFNIPRALLNHDFYLCAGTIDDADETYLNGTRIGATGRFPPRSGIGLE